MAGSGSSPVSGVDMSILPMWIDLSASLLTRMIPLSS